MFHNSVNRSEEIHVCTETKKIQIYHESYLHNQAHLN